MNSITDFKMLSPGFLKRRMKRYLQTQELKHYDDVAVACIVIEDKNVRSY